MRRTKGRSRRALRPVLSLESLEWRQMLSYGAPAPAFLVNETIAGGQSAPRSVVDDQGRVNVVWQDYGGDGSGYGVYARSFDVGGNPVGTQFRVNAETAGDQTDPRIAVRSITYQDDGLIVTWRDGGQVDFQLYDAQGLKVGEPTPLAGVAGVPADYELVGLPSGGFLIVTDDQIYTFGADGTPAGSTTLDRAHAGWTVQDSDAPGRVGILYYDTAVVTWAETRSRQNAADETVYDARIWAAPLNSYDPMLQGPILVAEIDDATSAAELAALDPTVVRPAGYYGTSLIAWRQAEAAGTTFHARQIDYDGTPIGEGFTLATAAPGDSEAAAIGWLGDDALAVFFVDQDPAGPDGGYIQIFGADGTPIDGPIAAPDVAADSLASLTVVPTAGSDFLLIWGDPQADPTAGEVSAQRFASTRKGLGISNDGLDVSESVGQAVFTVIRSGDLSQAASVRYATRDGSALAGYDYTPTSGVLNFAPGQALGTIALSVVDDHVAENYKYFYVSLSDPVGVDDLGNVEGYVSIEDDEPAAEHPLVFVDYDAYGLWTYNQVEGWAQINTVDPQSVLTTWRRDAYIDFGPGGLWHWDQLRGYSQISAVDPQSVMLDENGDSVYIDFGYGGLWKWSESAGYTPINSVDPQQVIVQFDHLDIDFGPGGLWRWSEAAGYTQISPFDPEAVASNYNELYIDFGAGGLWRWSGTAGFAQLHTVSPETMTLGYTYDVASGYGDVLYLDYGAGGLWQWSEGAGFSQINAANPESVVYDGYQTLYIDFGTGGLWKWGQTAGYQQVNGANPELVAFSSFDQALYIGFGAGGFWRWSATDGFRKLNDAAPPAFSVA
ncbi:Calx-beta domain-containing protein [Paludisphaera mucosa]|uniref:Calx-beta domain-containing protein n=1 Tax=Paludisphaera mucosa TaxID=3030827 RepID=A0ABT6FIV7_9BACT|nr:Calx-beta domain-containing protein [Paludisphaera mucosa]MDG3007512.1 Calx-beta domain-containing protein [Paludisphaera mucosa]